MTLPMSFAEPEPLEARLVTKTSLPAPKKAIALLILLWFANDKPDIVEYGKTSASQKSGGIIDEETVNALTNYAVGQSAEAAALPMVEVLKKNPLFESQMEALNSAFELVWHLASFSFVDSTLNRTAERKGGTRYRKCIKYSTNLDLIDLIGADNPQDLTNVLFCWLSDGLVLCDSSVERSLVRTLAVFSESSVFKTSKGDDGVVFIPSGIYDALLTDCGPIDIVDPGEETQGTTRILRPAIDSGLNPMLKSDDGKVVCADNVDRETLRKYSNRAKTGVRLSNVKVSVSSLSANGCVEDHAGTLDKPYNWIFFGAPGTGKSFELNRIAVGDAEGKQPRLFEDSNIRRVTFYPDYTYSQFFGCFKPCTRYEDPRGDEPASTQRPYISYEFVPGPFLEIYIKAVQNPKQNFLLIIEEINRSNPAAVFGDVFQLLDRNANGCSEYEIAVPQEVRDFFSIRLPEYATSARISDPVELFAEQQRLAVEINRLSLPSNMYIWATMNSADQGVFPMDTAFKRRWNFCYIGIDDKEEVIADIEVQIPEEGGVRLVRWNDLRHSINKLLLERAGVNEDKLLGPFFIAPSTINNSGKFCDAFKDSVLMYIFEDAGRTKRKRLFARENATYSQICVDFDECGVAVFVDGFEEIDDVAGETRGEAVCVLGDNAGFGL